MFETSTIGMFNPFHTFGMGHKNRKRISISKPMVLGTFPVVSTTRRRESGHVATEPLAAASASAAASAAAVGRKKVYYDVVQDYLPNSDEEEEIEVQRGFVGQSSGYLNIHQGDIVQLINKGHNNLLYVKLVNRLGEGFVPSRCLRINEQLSGDAGSLRSDAAASGGYPGAKLPPLPIGLPPPTPHRVNPGNRQIVGSIDGEGGSWCSTMLDDSTLNSDGSNKDTAHDDNDTNNTNNTNNTNKGSQLQSGVSCYVDYCSVKDNRVWYKIECELSTGHHRTLCRYYQDFYWLHLELIDRLRRVNSNADISILPRLPAPSKNVTKEGVAATRVEGFNKYLKSLFQSEHIPELVKVTVIVDQWLAPRSGDLVRTPQGYLYRVRDVGSSDARAPAAAGTANSETAGITLEHPEQAWEVIPEKESPGIIPQPPNMAETTWFPQSNPYPTIATSRSMSAIIRSGVSPKSTKTIEMVNSAPSTPQFFASSSFQSSALPSMLVSTLVKPPSSVGSSVNSSPTVVPSAPVAPLQSLDDRLPQPKNNHLSLPQPLPTASDSSKFVPIKMKVHYKDDIYAVRCTWDLICSYESLLHMILPRLRKDLEVDVGKLQLCRRLTTDDKHNKHSKKSSSSPLSTSSSCKETILSPKNYKELMADLRVLAASSNRTPTVANATGIASNKATDSAEQNQTSVGQGRLNIFVRIKAE
ncbi:uncharacterized protein Ecym_7161 [Eremothecium cymbalariae DBVPG|uniref:PX domain-containing protein n=1 Tax=Eremothecium cymbalariae (strain CBS 270.75 / DBVPG 7215 / KCTC 17166 / NRRL Y-17582) TaxID=931890 RepID=G8JVZ4_ERECY|nr:hypothetical protein Ecym_7161 [Eremothecium cymbalariae DBVPG\